LASVLLLAACGGDAPGDADGGSRPEGDGGAPTDARAADAADQGTDGSAADGGSGSNDRDGGSAVRPGEPGSGTGPVVPCPEPDLTWGQGGDFTPQDDWDDVLSQMARDTEPGASVVLGILPDDDAHYALSSERVSSWQKLEGRSVTICGMDEKVTLEVHDGRNSLGIKKHDHLTLYNLHLIEFSVDDPTYGLTAENVVYERQNLEPGGECVGPVGPTPQNPELQEINGHKQTNPAPPGLVHVSFKNVTFKGCGGDQDHAVYWAKRGCTLHANNVRVEHVGGLEGFRSLCRFTFIENSHFQNFIGTDPDEPESPLRGAAPVDFPSAGFFMIRDSSCTMLDSDARCFASRARRSIAAGGMPEPCEPAGEDYADIPQCDEIGSRFFDSAFWSDVRALPVTDPDNPYIFPKIIENVTFTAAGSADGRRVPMSTSGTTHRRNTGSYSSSSQFYHHPDQWTERAVSFWAHNRYVGPWEDGQLTVHGDTTPVDESSLPDQTTAEQFFDSVSKPEVVRVAGDGEAGDEPLPAWWPTGTMTEICNEWQQRLTWPDETPDGEGFPACPGDEPPARSGGG
jgi:hypothetical protein